VAETKIAGFQCERCGHEWVAKTERRPIICPKCKSPYWDRPRVRTLEKK
jgi:predicted Zn-ribbon and HTH transcriptional regulator